MVIGALGTALVVWLNPYRLMSPPWFLNPMLIPEIIEFERLFRRFLAQLGAGDAYRVALYCGLHFHLAVLDQTHDLLREIGLDPFLDLDDLLHLVAADLLD